ncbi:MAG: nucleotide exchange factor GrpE, partial [Clostridiales bacterium]|nr:nucleotide exchange factor GrpE [Clostridiales bacterium]
PAAAGEPGRATDAADGAEREAGAAGAGNAAGDGGAGAGGAGDACGAPDKAGERGAGTGGGSGEGEGFATDGAAGSPDGAGAACSGSGAAGGDGDGGDGSGRASLQSRLDEKDRLCREYLDRLQRSAAEFDNYKKRTLREKEALYIDASADVIGAFLPVVDSLERAVAALRPAGARAGSGAGGGCMAAGASSDSGAAANVDASSDSNPDANPDSGAAANVEASSDAGRGLRGAEPAGPGAAGGEPLCETGGEPGSPCARPAAAAAVAPAAPAGGQCSAGGADSPLAEGLLLIDKQVKDVLKKFSVEQLPGVGAQFDPNLHNAVMHVEDELAGKNTIVEEFQKGYIYKERVIRHSMVKVAN